MKLILFADKLPPLIGGMETHAHYFVKYFKKDWDLQIISKVDGNDVLVDFDYNPIEQIDIYKFLSAYRDEKTVLFFNSGRWIEQLTAIRGLLPHAVITYRTGGNEIIQAPLSKDMPDYEQRKSFWKNAINGSVDFLITNSEYTDMRLKQFGISSKILVRICGGVDKDIIRQAVADRIKTRKAYGIAGDAKLIVSCARFVPYKRVDFLIQAISLCKSQATLIVAGDGPLEAEIKAFAKTFDYPIRFLSAIPQEQAVRLIAAADVYAQASVDYTKTVTGGSYVHTEGMGRSLIEAVCCGVPVVVTECGAVGEYINSHNGSLVNDKVSFAAAVDKFLTDDVLYVNNIGQYVEQYSFDTIFERYALLWA